MVVIRLSRVGAKKRPFYHVVVTDSRRRRDGNYVENIGYFNPVARGQEVRLHLDTARLDYWQSVGAQLSDRVRSLVKEFSKKAESTIKAA
jgi:small subunit ribosomal protein S16